MARTMMPDTAGSQFFLMHKTSPHLTASTLLSEKSSRDWKFVDKIANVRTDYSDRPLEKQQIKSMTVETFGVDYPEPEKC